MVNCTNAQLLFWLVRWIHLTVLRRCGVFDGLCAGVVHMHVGTAYISNLTLQVLCNSILYLSRMTGF